MFFIYPLGRIHRPSVGGSGLLLSLGLNFTIRGKLGVLALKAINLHPEIWKISI